MMKKIYNPKADVPAVYIPCWLIQIPVQKISHGAKILYGRLAQWSREDGTVYRSKNDLKEEVGVSLRTLGDLIKELKDVGLIDAVQPIKGGISHYIFYDHEWMVEPIKKQLVYKSDEKDPMQNSALPNAEYRITPMQDPAHININKIKINNNIKNKGTSDEVHNMDYTVSDGIKGKNEKSDLLENQPKTKTNGLQVIETNVESLRSDYSYNQPKNKSNSKLRIPYNLKIIQENNIFQIPEQIIHDWIANRKKKRAAVTQTAWNRINRELEKCREQGIDPIEAFETMVASGWQSLKVEYFQNKKPLTPHKRVDNMDTSWGEQVFKSFHEIDLGI